MNEIHILSLSLSLYLLTDLIVDVNGLLLILIESGGSPPVEINHVLVRVCVCVCCLRCLTIAILKQTCSLTSAHMHHLHTKAVMK